MKEDKASAEYALAQIDMLYDVERRADEENLSFEERSELRCRLYINGQNILDWFKQKYQEVKQTIRPHIRPTPPKQKR